MAGLSYRIATVWGIPIRVHTTLVVLLLGIVAVGVQGGMSPVRLGYYLLFTLCLLASVALHEMGHAFVALRKGAKVREITLMFIGGSTRIENLPANPTAELEMALAGPFVNFCLAMICCIAACNFYSTDNAEALKVFFVLCVSNVLLMITNLIPAFPMDGGRVLRALLSRRLGRLRATKIASRMGKIFALTLLITGLAWINSVRRDPEHQRIEYVFPLMLVIFSFAIYSGAAKEYRNVRMQERSGTSPTSIWDILSNLMHPKPPPKETDDDKVIISPPPYEKKGKNAKAEIHSSNDVFSRFGQ
ncbi:MAG: hypothetical protein C0404_00535 [Verrucomicrobia bacterium]|nr:hypothetical protein [Verrucomicrobiota bacterium]